MKAIRKASGTAPRRVLVVEDDTLLALALEDALTQAGVMRVTICPSAALAMAALEDGSPDVMIISVHLADRDDGWALAELAAFLGPRPPRIIFSTGAADEIPPEVARLGAIFEKPYDPQRLVDSLISTNGGWLRTRFREVLHR